MGATPSRTTPFTNNNLPMELYYLRNMLIHDQDDEHITRTLLLTATLDAIGGITTAIRLSQSTILPCLLVRLARRYDAHDRLFDATVSTSHEASFKT
jgi:hypothetical protein